MVKAPWWRVAGWEHVAPEVREQLSAAAEEMVAMLPFADLVREPQVVGSYARMRAQLHSDLDLHLEMLDYADPPPTLVRHPDIAQRLAEFIAAQRQALGVRIDLSIRHHSEVAAGKQVFGLRSGVWFNKVAGEASSAYIDYNPRNGERTVRCRRGGRFSIDRDPWEFEIEKWAQRYGDAYQRFGFTEDTAWQR